jgi:N-acetylglutamate synthase-like GNAT family acetyltransferase
VPADEIREATADDWPAIEQLLTESALPLDGAREHVHGFVVATDDGAVAGCAALERHGTSALLRSVAVARSRRGEGLGERLVRRLIAIAQRDGIDPLVLLTTTASDWFPRFGFRNASTEEVPAALTASAEFRGACPASAVVMILEARR